MSRTIEIISNSSAGFWLRGQNPEEATYKPCAYRNTDLNEKNVYYAHTVDE